MYETLGFWRALWLSPRWQIRKCYIVLATDLQSTSTAPALRASPVGVEWTVLGEQDIRAIRTAHPRLSEAELRRRWGEGQECIGGFIGGALAHIRWDSAGPAYLPYLRRAFHPLDGDTLVVEAFTCPAFRGRGLHSHSTALALDRDRARGLTRSITLVAWWNAAALRVTQQKAGREVAGTVGYWQIGPATRHFATGAVEVGRESVRVRRAVGSRAR